MQNVNSISFKVAHGSTLRAVSEQTWGLGLGPCGREVSELSYEITLATLTIRQVSHPVGYLESREEVLRMLREGQTFTANRPLVEAQKRHESFIDPKRELFVYRLEDIVGRIKALL